MHKQESVLKNEIHEFFGILRYKHITKYPTENQT